MIAVLRCRHLSTEAAVTWWVNGSPAGQFPDIIMRSIIDDGTLVNTLTIPSIPQYNGAEVVCVVFIDGSPPVSERTPPVVLTIVGGKFVSRLYTGADLVRD